MSSLADLLLLVVLGLLVLVYIRLGRIEQHLSGRRPGGPRRFPGRGKVVEWPHSRPEPGTDRRPRGGPPGSRS